VVHVRFYMDWKTGLVGMEAQGHAMTAPKGEDLICAGVTALVYTLAQSLQFLYEQDRLKERPKVQICEGYANIKAMPKKIAEGEVLMAFWVLQSGFYVLEHNYPKSISLMPLEFGKGEKGR